MNSSLKDVLTFISPVYYIQFALLHLRQLHVQCSTRMFGYQKCVDEADAMNSPASEGMRWTPAQGHHISGTVRTESTCSSSLHHVHPSSKWVVRNHVKSSTWCCTHINCVCEKKHLNRLNYLIEATFLLFVSYLFPLGGDISMTAY